MTLFEKQVKEMIEDGILCKVNDDFPKRYLPLLAIVDLSRKSTKVRVCLKEKVKNTRESVSDALEMNEILLVLTRFRM